MAKIPSLLSSKDVAHILDCSPDDVIQLARERKLLAEKKGGVWRFKREDVNKYTNKEKGG